MIIENTPFLETERLLLRKFTQDDLQDILLIYADAAANEFLPWFPLTSMEEATQFLANILADYAKPAAYRYAIALKTDNRAIGYVNISDLGKSNDLGYGLRKEFWYYGIAAEACIAVCKRCKAAGYSYITATHDVNNPSSGQVMKKIGMSYR